mgnify:FL=1
MRLVMKGPSLSCNPGGKCSIATLVWMLAVWILLLHLYTSFYPRKFILSDPHSSLRRLPYSEFEGIEDKDLFVSGKKRVNPSNRPHRTRNISASEDFMNPSSLKRQWYFPDKSLAINPLTCPEEEKNYLYPGREWRDTEGRPIQAHGGGILYVPETKTFYWYGENKDGRTYYLQKRSVARV